MKTLLQLKREATTACKQQGHTMYAWYNFGTVAARSVCVHCRKEVQVETQPLANSIDIGGEAVALNCND